MCRVLEVSPSGYYASRKRPPSWHALIDEVLMAHVRIITTRAARPTARPVRRSCRRRGCRPARSGSRASCARRTGGPTAQAVSRVHDEFESRRSDRAESARAAVRRPASASIGIWVADITHILRGRACTWRRSSTSARAAASAGRCAIPGSRAGAERAPHGARGATPAAGIDPSFRSGKPIHVGSLPCARLGPRDDCEHEPQGRLLRQRGGGELLLDARVRAAA